MRYIINLIVIFDTKKKELMLNNNKNITIELTRPAARVLHELIKSNGQHLPHETILTNAWENFGFTPSRASLNNCISELRKAFETLGLEKKIIITIPRHGFRLEAEIHPIPLMSNDHMLESVKKITSAETQSSLPVVTDDEKKAIQEEKKNTLFKRKYFLSLILFIVILLIAIGLWPKENGPVLLGHEDSCNIYSISQDAPTQDKLSKVNKMLTQENINCKQDKKNVYFSEERAGNDLLKITFIAVCNRTSSGCLNYKIIE